MTRHEESLPVDVRALLDDAAPEPGPDADASAQLWARLSKSLDLPPIPPGDGGPDDGGPDGGPDGSGPDGSGGGGGDTSPAASDASGAGAGPTPSPAMPPPAPVAASAAAKSAGIAALLTKPVPLALTMFALGTASGIGLHATVLAPDPVVETRAPESVAVPPPTPAAPVEAPPVVANPPQDQPIAKPDVRVRRRPDQVVITTDQLLAEERSLVEMARSALARGDHEAALKAVDEHATQFADGRLAEEREFIRIQALVGLGRLDDAKQAEKRFESAHPRSFFIDALRELVGAGARE